MSLIDNFILNLEENGYSLRAELKETLKFAKDNYRYSFLINKISLDILFNGDFNVYKFQINSNIKLSTFHNLSDSIVSLSKKGIGISIDTHSYRKKNTDVFHFRLRPYIYAMIPNQLLIDQEEPILSEFRYYLCQLTEETNCNFYAEPWKAFKLQKQYK